MKITLFFIYGKSTNTKTYIQRKKEKKKLIIVSKIQNGGFSIINLHYLKITCPKNTSILQYFPTTNLKFVIITRICIIISHDINTIFRYW